MARRIGFHVYSVRVRERYSREYETLSALRGRQDLLVLLCTEMTKARNAQNDNEEHERVVCIRRVDKNGRHLTGLIETGHYGETSNIVHAKNGRVTHLQTTEEASLLPCFFRLVIPSNKNQGLLILQRDNRLQAKQIFRGLVEPAVKKFDSNLSCEIEPVVNQETFAKLVGDGEIQQIKFIKLSITQDFADEYDRGKHETEGSMELTIKARRGRSLPMKSHLTKWLATKTQVNDLFVVPGLDFDYDTVKADVRIGHSRRTLDFGKRLSNPVIDMTGQLKRDKSGHPTYASLLEETEKLAADQMFDAFGE